MKNKVRISPSKRPINEVFRIPARRQGWTEDELDEIYSEALQGNSLEGYRFNSAVFEKHLEAKDE